MHLALLCAAGAALAAAVAVAGFLSPRWSDGDDATSVDDAGESPTMMETSIG
jgi:hypothetical protein